MWSVQNSEKLNIEIQFVFRKSLSQRMGRENLKNFVLVDHMERKCLTV